MTDSPHRIVVADPGHFHAALTLRLAHPRLSRSVHVFAQDGPDLERFLALVRGFGERAVDPVHWHLEVHRGPDWLARACEHAQGAIAIVAGRNDSKMGTLSRLHAAGACVLGDKPWIIGAEGLPALRAVAHAGPPAMDIMTERHEVATRLQRALMAQPAVFGAFRGDSGPALRMRSVHHLYKTVQGKALVRPPWYFDTGVQGEGITDVNTHLVDLAFWFTDAVSGVGTSRTTALECAAQWPTAVPREMFRQITGLADFPGALREHVRGDNLYYLCNAEIGFRVGDVAVLVEALWDLAIPEGGGDTHFAVARGTRSDLVVEQSRETRFVPELTVVPHGGLPALRPALEAALEDLQPAFPGVESSAEESAFRIRIPARLRSSHEEHFAEVLDEFLTAVDEGSVPAKARADLVAKYELLTTARERATREPEPRRAA